MNLKNVWRGSMSYKGAVLVALVSLVVGLGISGSLDWLAPSRAVVGEGPAPEGRSSSTPRRRTSSRTAK